MCINKLDCLCNDEVLAVSVADKINKKQCMLFVVIHTQASADHKSHPNP